MKDIAITWDATAMEGVISFDTAINDLTTDEGLTTAVFISLFTDARAEDDDPIPDERDGVKDLRGWWADSTSEKEGDSVGSRLWLLERSKVTQEVLEQAKLYAAEALQWMVDEGIASKVETSAEVGGPNEDRLYIGVVIYRASGESISFKFDSAWEAMK